ncbi:hypothetical protein [Sphingobacterium psychroaquaticum]|uniref:Uncharacterized protein n=1 Tax=Sphingobacterium psychroaquaticum TaxID=561061 RepID=A0A1X7K4I0_9SPHI|nr:hypothetical protein [Sphingobacterium psychroaquaticum]SMG35810.1 hypothetical protein SAMN05660862_2552 [Sphingobacterium psychroaquaticum]
MPIMLGNIVAVSKEELVPHFFKSENTLYSTIQRYKELPYGIKRVMIGGNGRQLLIDLDTLPGHIKDAIHDPRKSDHVLERYYSVDPDAVRFYAIHKFDDGTYLSMEHQERYIINASVLKAAIALRNDRLVEWRNKGRSKSGIMQSLVADVLSFNESLRKKFRIEHDLPKSVGRFKESLNTFETLVNGSFNYEGLISKKHRNINSRKVDENTVRLLNDMFADKVRKPTAKEIHEQYDGFVSGYVQVVNNKTGELYSPKGYKQLSISTVTAYLARWENRIATHQKRSDDRQLNMGKFKPYYSFEMPKFSGSMISIDDRQPPFKSLSGKRVWFYLAVDVASRAITCAVYGETKEGIILEFYRQMVRNYYSWGLCLPAELECEMSLNSSYTDTILKEGVMFDYIKMEANNARGKYIERVNEELRYRKEKGRDGWLARPKALSETNQPGVDIEKVPRIPFDTIVNDCLADIDSWNNEPHPTEEGISKWEYFLERQHPSLSPINFEAILPYIGNRTETSCKLGNIQLNNGLCLIGDHGIVAKGERLIQVMKQIEGQEIEVYWLDDDQGEVMKAYAYIDGKCVCEIVRKPRPIRARLERSAADELAEGLLAAYTNTVDAFGKRQREQLDGVVIIKEDPAPLKHQIFSKPSTRIKHTERQPIELPQYEDVDEDYSSYSSLRQSIKDRF